jgi:hypothetical protein
MKEHCYSFFTILIAAPGMVSPGGTAWFLVSLEPATKILVSLQSVLQE